MDDLTGQQWGSYQLGRLLNRGSSADVYTGSHTRFLTPAVLEIFHAHLSGERVVVFQNEARALIQLVHPQIVRLLDFDIQDERPFLVLDAAPGGLVSQRFPYGTRLPLEQVVVFCQQIAGALQYAHARQVVHGEVQPEHLWLNERDEVLLSGFGVQSIARVLLLADAQIPAGSLAYMAPEQMQGQALPASDQYALAVIVYQWLCGVWPFVGGPAELVAQHISRQPPSLRQHAPDVSQAVEQVVLQALVKDPARRFASVQTFAHALVQAARGGSSEERVPHIAPPPPLDSFQSASAHSAPACRPVSRRTLLVGSAIVAGLALAGGTGALIVRSQGGAQSTLITGDPAGTLLTVYRGQQTVPTAAVEESSVALLWSADSRRILSVGGKDGTFQCWDALSGGHVSTYRPLIKADENIAHTVQWRQQNPVRLWLDGVVVRLTDVVTNQDIYSLDETTISPDGIDEICWSPDGSLFATIETNYLSHMAPTLVHVHRGADGSGVSSFHPPYTQGTNTDAWIQQRPIFLAWSPDNTRLLSWGEDNLLYIWRVSNGALLFVNRRYAQSKQVLEASVLAWSPDGTYLATATAGTLDIWKPDDGTIVSSMALPANSAVFLTWSPDSRLLAMSNYSQLSVLAPGRSSALFTHDYNGGGFTIYAWSPDSRRLAASAWVSPTDPPEGNAANPLFTVWDARSGEHAVTYADSDRLGASLAYLAWSPDGRYLALQRSDSLVEIWQPH